MRLTRFILALTIVAWAGAVEAQSTGVAVSQRPYRGIFKSGVGDSEQMLAIQGWLGAGYDDNVLAASGTFSQDSPWLAQRGNFGIGAAAATYFFERNGVRFDAGGDTTFRYYSNIEDVVASHRGTASLSLPLGDRTRLRLIETGVYRPFNLLQLFTASDGPGDLTAGLDHDFAIASERYLTYTTQAGLDRKLGRRGVVAVEYALARNDFSDNERNQTTQMAGAMWTFGLAKGLGGRLGYRELERRYPRGAQRSVLRGHTLDAGVDYDRQLSLTRKTSIRFGSGSSAVSNTATTIYRLTGRAQLSREIARTWTAVVRYDRNFEVIEPLDEPFFYDAAIVSVEGLLHRRVAFQTLVRAATGDVGLSPGYQHDTYSGTAGLIFALSRYVAAEAGYVYYQYTFANTAALPAFVPPKMSRQGVRINLSLWAPLFSRMRSSDAAR